MNRARTLLARACCCSLALAASACAPKQESVMTVSDLMEDRVALDGLLMKCSQPQGGAQDVSCANARAASAELARRSEAAQEAKRAEEFERNRQKLRDADDQRRREAEAKQVDAYHLPVVPVDPPPASGAAAKSH